MKKKLGRGAGGIKKKNFFSCLKKNIYIFFWVSKKIFLGVKKNFFRYLKNFFWYQKNFFLGIKKTFLDGKTKNLLFQFFI